MTGKNKCKILREIRQKIAEDNDIAYVTSECKYQGECSGTCPKCEEEVRYLEQELQKRQQLGKRIALAGVAAALVVSAAGCRQMVKDAVADLMTEEGLQGAVIPYIDSYEETEPTDE